MRALLKVVAVLAVVVAVLFVAGGWYYSTQLLDPGVEDAPTRTLAVVDVTDTTVTLRPQDDTPDWQVRDLGDDLLLGLDTAGGHLLVSGPPVSTDGDAVERTADVVTGARPAAGDRARLTTNTQPHDPAVLGLPVEEVTVTGPVGDLPGWVFPGSGEAADDWVVYVHGRGGDRATALRTVPHVVGELGHSALVVTHRNDVGAPPSPDGHGHFGDTEWEDLEAWLLWLDDQHDVDTLALFAFSQGASVSASCLRRCVDEVEVDRAVLESPLLSIDATLDLQAADRGVPDPLIDPLLGVTEVITGLRGGPDLDNLEHVGPLADLDLPILAFHGDRDMTVPIEPTDSLADADPDQVTFVTYEGGHTRGWNVDPEGYEDVLTDFLSG